MQVGEAGGVGRDVTADSLLDAAEQAFLRAEFDIVRPLLQRLRSEFGAPGTDSAAVRYDALLGALAARAENWPEAVRRCPDSGDLDLAETGVLHSLAVSALRELAREGRHTDTGTAAVAIVLWAYLLDEYDFGDFRALLTERRGAPVPDEFWEQALGQLRGRVADLLRALDARAGRDVLSAWHTAWEAQCEGRIVYLDDLPAEPGSYALITLDEAAWHLVEYGHRDAFLAAYTARRPDPGTWVEDAPEHRACAVPLARALAGRGRDRAQGGKWSEALADFGAAVRLGHSLKADEKEAVARAWKNVGRSWTGRDNDPLVRIDGLEQARVLLPQDSALAAELTAELVRRGRQVARTDPRESRDRFTRALVVTPGNPAAQAGLDGLLEADLRRTLDGAHVGEEPLADEVRDLLTRAPDCLPARQWLGRHSEEQAVALAVSGRTDEARSAVREMLRYKDPTRPPGQKNDNMLVGLLVVAARHTDSGDRAGLERRVELLHTAAAIPSRLQGRVREDLDEALLHLAEHLEATASPSDVIELFLRDLIRTGVSARFDKVVENAYVLRAAVRKRAGDLGGALRDLEHAERIGDGLSPQTPLFGPARRASRRNDPGQDTLF
ncbi:hypothetical protein [Streptomyces sp. NK15101]|uniref:hypothetical protein n=1 Tax=Streptomyces sp. NK15101 TaxID=2873261 RepID=UPI001CECCFE0|nr:hypothetical protein [Streptomyces sp. NK15101]